MTGAGRVGQGSTLARVGSATVVTALVPMLLSAGAAAAARLRDGAPGAAAAAGTISTVAGGPGGPARGTQLRLDPCDVAFAGGSLYIADAQAIRKLNPGSDWLTTPVGTGSDGPLGDGGPATRASLESACSVAVDGAGNLVLADRLTNRIRVAAATTGTFYGKAMTIGDIYTVAGNGTAGFSGEGAPATSAELSLPNGVTVDGAGNLVIADGDNNRIRVVAATTGTFYGRAMTAGDIYTVAGNGTAGFSGEGGPATSAELDDPWAAAVDGAGNLVISDQANYRIRVVAAKAGTFYGKAMTAGDIYTVAGNGHLGFSGDGGPAIHASLGGTLGVMVDGHGNLLIADAGSNRVRVVAVTTGMFYGQAMTAGDIYTIAGDGKTGDTGDRGPATSAGLHGPEGVAIDGSGNVVITTTRVRVVAESTGTFYDQAMTAGDIYTVAGRAGSALCCVGRPATAGQIDPLAVAVDRAGNTLIAASQVAVAAASTGTFYGRAMTAGDLYTVAGNGTAGFSGDGGPATGAEIDSPEGLTVDAASNVVLADTFNNRIRVVAGKTGTFYGRPMTAGDIYTVAGDGSAGFSGDGGPATDAELSRPTGVAVDGAGNLVIADQDNNRVRVVAAKTGSFYGQAMTAGDIYTVAGTGIGGFSGDGGPATSAEVSFPAGVAVDGSGNLVIADQENQRIRVVAAKTGTFYGQAMTAHHIYTVAGDGTEGFSGDGGPATRAKLNAPTGVTADGTGNLVIADLDNNRVRVVAVATGTFYGQPMTAGDIYTVAGDGSAGFSGDGGPGTQAELDNPNGVTVAGSGALMISDGANSRIRELTG